MHGLPTDWSQTQMGSWRVFCGVAGWNYKLNKTLVLKQFSILISVLKFKYYHNFKISNVIHNNMSRCVCCVLGYEELLLGTQLVIRKIADSVMECYVSYIYKCHHYWILNLFPFASTLWIFNASHLKTKNKEYIKCWEWHKLAENSVTNFEAC